MKTRHIITIIAVCILAVLFFCFLHCPKTAVTGKAAQEKENIISGKAVSEQLPAVKQPEVVRADYQIKELDRFNLAPRSKAGTPDLESEEGKSRVAESQARQEERQEEILNRIVNDPQSAESWLNYTEKQLAGNTESLALLKNLRENLLPSQETMRAKLKEKQESVTAQENEKQKEETEPAESQPSVSGDVANPAGLETEYRKIFVEEMKAEIEKYVNQMEGVEL